MKDKFVKLLFSITRFVYFFIIAFIFAGQISLESKAEENLKESSRENIEEYRLIFDAEYYYSMHKDEVSVLCATPEGVLTSFKMVGMKAGYQGNEYFNVQSYKQRYPDLQSSYGENYILYYIHYMRYGHREYRNGSYDQLLFEKEVSEHNDYLQNHTLVEENTTEENTTEENTTEENTDSIQSYEPVVTEYSSNALGWSIENGEYLYRDRITGERLLGTVVDGITIAEDGSVPHDEYSFNRIDTMMKAHYYLDSITEPEDSMETKRQKAFDWVLSFSYKRFRFLSEIYQTEAYIEVVFANDIFDHQKGDCVSESAAIAFLFHEIGYEEVYLCHDTGHAWVMSDGKLFDPLFAESKGYEQNYNVDFYDYRSNPVEKIHIY